MFVRGARGGLGPGLARGSASPSRLPEPAPSCLPEPAPWAGGGAGAAGERDPPCAAEQAARARKTW